MVQKVSGKLPEVKQKNVGYQKLKNNVHFKVIEKCVFQGTSDAARRTF